MSDNERKCRKCDYNLILSLNSTNAEEILSTRSGAVRRRLAKTPVSAERLRSAASSYILQIAYRFTMIPRGPVSVE
jgi:hypothetical protein